MRKKGKMRVIIESLKAKKCEDLTVLDTDKSSDFWEYFVVCTGGSGVHIRTLFTNLEENMKKQGYSMSYRDTGNGFKWIISDFGDVLVHIFDRETRDFYAIEKLWGEKEVKPSRFIPSVKKKKGAR